MKASNRCILITCLIVFGILFSVPAMAFNVVVGDFSGTSTNGSFVNHVWTPEADSNLDIADLLVEITGNDVEIITNGSGNITVNTVFLYTLAFNRQLTVSASGDIILSGINFSSTGSISVIASASGSVTVNAAGLYLNGGSFTSFGTDCSIINGDGVNTDGGNATLNHTGSVTIYSGGVNTDGGSFTSSGTDFSSGGSGLLTNSGNVTLNHTGSVTVTNGGAKTGGGSFTSSGTDFFSNHDGMMTDGGNVELNHTGSVTVTNSGAETGGGNFRINSSGSASFSDNGVNTNGGNIFVQSNGLIIIDSDTNINTGDPANGGDITFRSATGITIDSVMTTQPGSGGVLSLEGNTGAIALNQAPTLGQGNITLYVGALSLSIPTLSEWGVIIFALVLIAAAMATMRRRTPVQPF
jgi:hypothetical protein